MEDTDPVIVAMVTAGGFSNLRFVLTMDLCKTICLHLGLFFVSMYRAKDSCPGSGSCKPRCSSRVYVQGKVFTSFFLFHYVQGLHYAYGTGSFKLSNYVNNMHRAVYPRVRLVIPSNYPQGSVFLSSASVFLSYC